MAGKAHLFDALSLLGYALAAYGDANLNEFIRKIVDGRESWNRSWLADDMKEDPGQLAARITFLLEEEFHRVAHRFSQRAHTEAEC